MTETFFDLPGNPRPAHGAPAFMTARDGLRLRYAIFEPDARPHAGTIVVLTGRNETIEKYFETIRDLNAQGLAVAIMDWRGQGGSGRLLGDPDRGHVGRFDDYVADLDQFFSSVVLPDCRGPHFLLAHSTGALIALLASPHLANRVRRMVLIAPFLAPAGLSVSLATARRIIGLLYWSGLGRMYAYGGAKPKTPPSFATNRLTTDARRFARNVGLATTHPPLGLGGPTVSWVRAAFRASARVQDPGFMDGFRIPTLFIAAGADEVVSKEAVQAYARRIKTGSLVTIDGASHEILQEADIYREQALAAIRAFIPGCYASPNATLGV